ncbi:MAG: EamA family transporter [Lentisphaeria bacterium]|nr:EamA family transporter [Lentisphaeria bacterium]
MAIFWAFACMFFAACNDLLFKFFAGKNRGNGFFVSVVGVVWLVVALIPALLGQAPADWRATIIWGCISGFFSLAGNIMMLDAMRSLDVGVCSTIYRLNLVPVTVGAALILNENITPIQYAGIAAACLAILAFIPRNQSEVKRKLGWAFIVMIIASLLRSGMGLSYRYGFLHGASEKYVVVINSLFWIFGGVLYAFWRERHLMPYNKQDWKNLFFLGGLSGALVTGIVITMALMLKLGNASVVLPIAQMSFLVTGALGIWLFKERLTVSKAMAFILGVAAVLLLSIKF